MNKKERGITLIALVITIIVLLLLAGISISMLSGQNGILTKASDSKTATKNTEDYEGVLLATQTALVDGLGKVDLEDDGDLEKALGSNYNYLGEGLVEKDGKYYTVAEDGTVIRGGVKVGDFITYIPPSVTDAKWSAEYSGLKDKDETAIDIVLDNTLDATNANSFKVTSWRVLSIEDGKINLVSTEETTGKVFLGYANGYNNAVKLLNDACNELYGNKEKGIIGRNIKIEDIEGLMTKEGLTSAHSYAPSANPVKYGLQTTNIYTTDNYYPTIYADEKLSVINEVKKEAGLGMSEQDKYYKGSTEPPTVEGVTKSIQPYQTFWSKSSEDMKKYLEGENSVNYELIMPNKEETSYVVASRCIDTRTNRCGFGINKVDLGAVSICRMCASGSNNYSSSVSFRPVISLSSDLLVRNVAGEGTVTWSVK